MTAREACATCRLRFTNDGHLDATLFEGTKHISEPDLARLIARVTDLSLEKQFGVSLDKAELTVWELAAIRGCQRGQNQASGEKKKEQKQEVAVKQKHLTLLKPTKNTQFMPIG